MILAAAAEQKFDYDYSALREECINLPKEIGGFFGTLTNDVIYIQFGSKNEFDERSAEQNCLVYSKIDEAFQKRIQGLKEVYLRLSEDLPKDPTDEVEELFWKTSSTLKTSEMLIGMIWSKLFIFYFWAQNKGQFPGAWHHITHLSVTREYYSDWLKEIEGTQQELKAL